MKTCWKQTCRNSIFVFALLCMPLSCQPDEQLENNETTSDNDSTTENEAEENQLPDLIAVFPGDGKTDIPVNTVIIAQLFNDEDEPNSYCEFERSNTTVTVTGPNGSLEGRLFLYNSAEFPTSLRLDFRPTDFLLPATAYDVEVNVPCSKPSRTSFTTGEAITNIQLNVGDSVLLAVDQIDHPPTLGVILGGFLDQAKVLVQTLEVDESAGNGTIRFFGGESEQWTDTDTLVFDKNVTEFSMNLEGELQWPHFKSSGSLSFAIDADSEFVIDYFELGGTFVVSDSGITVSDGYIIGVASCDSICETLSESVPDDDFNCEGIRPQVCDENNDLNLFGTFHGESNDLHTIQTLSVEPLDGATNVTPDSSITISFTQALQSNRSEDILFEVESASSGNQIEGEVAVASDLLSATFTPANALPSGEYQITAVALSALYSTFSVQ